MVLDTDVVLAALRSPTGASATLLRLVEAGAVTLLASLPLALDYETICHQAKHRLASGLPAAEVSLFVNTLIGLAEPVEVHFRWRPLLLECVPTRFGIDVLLPRDALRRIRS